MKCPNHLCQHAIDASPAACPKCGIPLPGAVLADRFSLERIVRVTPFALTFQAFDRDRTAEAQIRLYIPRFGRRASNLKSEIKALKELQFEQLPRIFHLDWETDFPWLAEEKVQGSSMVGRLVGRDRPFSEPEAVQVLLEAAKILEKLHTLHVYHRDIRPETLFNRDTDNRLVLGTPGWDREFQEKPAPKNRPVYVAPEAGGGRATPQADLYSLGVTAVHLLTGLNPEGLYNAATRTFQWHRAVKVSPRLAEIVDGLVADAPGDRIQSAGRLVQLLSSLDRESAHPAAEEGKHENQATHSGGAEKHPVAATAAAVAVGAVAGAEAAARATTFGSPGAAPQPSPTRSANASWTGLKAHEVPAARRERKLKALLAAMAAAVAALLGVVAALWQRLLQGPFGQVLGAQSAKILVALGLATGTATVAAHLGGKQGERPAPPAREAASAASVAFQNSGYSLPPALIGYDDQAIPVEPDAAVIAQAAGRLPDPSLLGHWVNRRFGAAGETRRRVAVGAVGAGSASGAAPGSGRNGPAGSRFAFSDGTRPEVSNVLSLYSSLFPWQGRQFALGANPALTGQLSEISAAQLLAQTAGLPPSLLALTRQAPGGAPQTPLALPGATDVARHLEQASQAVADLVPPRLPGAKPEPASETRHDGGAADEPRRLASRSPYDPAVEPGTDPADAYGLRKPVSPYFIRINKTYRTLTLYQEGRFSAQYPIGIGEGATTPDGRFTIANKVTKPTYEGLPGGDPRNPLGAAWLGLDVSYPGGKAIGLHGTNNDGSLGEAESGGCIRLKNEDVLRLYRLVPPGTPVEII